MPSFFKDLYISVPAALGLALVAVGFGAAIFSLNSLDNLLIIHFTGAQGIDFLGNRIDVFEILLSGLAMNMLNIFVSYLLYQRIKPMSYLASFSNIFLSALILITVGVIVSVN